MAESMPTIMELKQTKPISYSIFSRFDCLSSECVSYKFNQITSMAYINTNPYMVGISLKATHTSKKVTLHFTMVFQNGEDIFPLRIFS